LAPATCFLGHLGEVFNRLHHRYWCQRKLRLFCPKTPCVNSPPKCTAASPHRLHRPRKGRTDRTNSELDFCPNIHHRCMRFELGLILSSFSPQVSLLLSILSHCVGVLLVSERFLLSGPAGVRVNFE